MARRANAGPYDSCIFKFFKEPVKLFQSSDPTLHFTRNVTQFLRHYLRVSLFFICNYSGKYLIISYCSSLMANNVNVFMCLLDTFSVFSDYIFTSFTHILIGSLDFCC